MQVFRTIPARAASPTVLAIGNFDGLHLGHRALLGRLTAKARELGLPSAVMTFEPHPRELFAPDQAPARLTSLREKLALIEACGVDRGDFPPLRQAGVEHDFAVEAMHTIDLDGERVSSSLVREVLAEGDLEHAARLLGRPYNISGRVVQGNRIGRDIGFPTANVQLKRKRLPLCGVFAVTVSGLDKRHLPGAASLGVRPTVGAGLKPTLEVHLLDFDRDIYGAHVTVHFLHKLRDEAKYDSLSALAAQIEKDVAATRTYFSGDDAHG